MEAVNDIISMLNLLPQSAFCVKDGTILYANSEAKMQFLEKNTSIIPLLMTGHQEYADFQGGCLYLNIQVCGASCGASVTRIDGYDVFVLEQDDDRAELQAMALAARELRQPLSSLMMVTNNLFPLSEDDSDPALQKQIARINRGLYQMQRIVCNMSDAYRYSQDFTIQEATRNISGTLNEIFTSAANSLEHTGLTLHYSGPSEPIYGLIDLEILERAINNILSNAIKFTLPGSTIEARVTQKNDMLYLTVQNSNHPDFQPISSDPFRRFQRKPGIENSKFGIGLGLVLVRAAAAAHGGTVLMEQSQERTTLTMTISIRESTEALVRTLVLRPDYAGERDHLLLEFADFLSAAHYNK